MLKCTPPEPVGAIKFQSLGIWVDEAEVTNINFESFRVFYDVDIASDTLSGQVFDSESKTWIAVEAASHLMPNGVQAADTLQPAVQVSWNDACAYCSAKNGRLPTADEWLVLATEDYVPGNIWEGFFPYKDEGKDGFIEVSAPVKSFNPNSLGFYDIYGNVREWTMTKDSLGNAVVKGGSFLTDYNSGAFIPEYSGFVNPLETHQDLGFRCVYDL